MVLLQSGYGVNLGWGAFGFGFRFGACVLHRAGERVIGDATAHRVLPRGRLGVSRRLKLGPRPFIHPTSHFIFRIITLKCSIPDHILIIHRPNIYPAPSLLRALTVWHGQISAPASTSASPPTSPSYSHSQSIHLASSSSSALRPSSPSAPTSHSDGWAIWSRRPRDPAHAPGVIISPRARPPPNVVASARAGGTPPPSPPPVPVERGEAVGEGAANISRQMLQTPMPTQDTPSSSTDYTDTRTTGTPVTTATTVPGSPLSSATSISVSKAAEPASAPAPAASTSTSPDAAEPEPAAPAAPPPKKSWASLLQPAASPAATAAAAGPQTGKQKLGGLPTSSVVGISIPAAGAGSGAADAPAADATAAAPKSFADASSASAAPTTSEKTREERLTPRGLVNTGNMCFANAVLQVLVYCAPFSSLFARLHALLGEADGGQDDGGGGGGVLGPAPLVRATGAFLREFIVSVNAKKPVNGGWGGKGKGKVLPAEEQEEEPEAFIPTHIYDALKGKKRFDGMRGGHQEDAEEFLGFFLDTLEEELLAVAAGLSPASAPASKRVTATPSADGTGRAVVEEREEEAPPETEDGWLEVGRKNRTVVTRTVKSAESPITRIFGGRFRSTLRAPGQKDSVIVEDWRSLRLDIQRDGIHTIADALALISHPQTVQMSHPSRPGIVVDASQQILIDALPPILILHVKRFCYDTAVGGVVKVGKRVAFGPELEVGNDVLVPTARKQPVRYKLFGVVYHHGVSASRGHYTLDVLHPTRFPGRATGTGSEREGWVRIDDELVSDVRPVHVFGAPEGDSRCAYLLFYRRVR
ncbi:hypothetical protein B0H14DRAFT_2538612 [Mycena olivaceomarginata]|nr:hypothetical protein B0H14DRAFT_2538612 [Mycena olivaceomarginata]